MMPPTIREVFMGPSPHDVPLAMPDHIPIGTDG